MNVTPQPSRLLVAGDVHGNVGWFRRLCDRAAQHSCDALLQLGDSASGRTSPTASDS